MPSRRGGSLALLAAAVLLAHLWLADGALPDRLDEGAARNRPVRMEVSFVQQLLPTTPAVVTRAEPAPKRLSAATVAIPAAASAASAAAAAQEALQRVQPEPLPAPQAQAVPEPAPPLPELAPPPAAVAVAAQPESAALPASSASAPAARAFEWPPSTRLTYRLSGNYRGPVDGQASVEWLRTGGRYQVFMDLSIGPSFAPLMSRRVASYGEITPQGLRPGRYDEETKVVLRSPRRLTVEMGADRVRLANGNSSPRPAGLQDSASQFVQLTWLFTTQPDLLQAGRTIELPLALPRVVEPWTYDVLGAELLNTPAGPVSAVHVKPRREPKPGGDLTAEIWVAPSLQYLPVRILIRQDSETWIDLAIDRLPEQALPGR